MLFHRKPKTPEGAAPPLETQVRQRRNRMAGMWAAELLGLIGQAAHDYAREVAHPHAEEEDEHVVRRLAGDLKGKKTVQEVRDKLSHLLHEARRQLLHEDKGDPPA